MENPYDSREDNSYICFNSLISICHLKDEEGENIKSSKYIMRKDNFSNFLVFRQINKSKYDYLNISDSFFYIRNIEECYSIYGSNSKDNENSEFSKESHFSNNNKLNQYTQFILQHLISGKFVSCIMNIKNNKITLKLVNDFENAYHFTLQKINKKRPSKGYLSFDQYFFLNIYVKEDNMNYYLEEEIKEDKIEKNDISIFENLENDISINFFKNNNKSDYNGIVLNRKPLYEILLINQTYIINQTNNIYSGHLINIIFTKKNNEKDEKMMLCLKEKTDYKHKFTNSIMKKSRFFEKDKNNFEVSCCAYKEELYEQVINNALWIIEDNLFYFQGTLNIKPVNIGENFRLKNAITGFYLDVRQRGIKVLPSTLLNKSVSECDNYEYEFCLVDDKTLEDKFFFSHNFKFFHNTTNDSSTYVVDEGKYILKGIFQNRSKQKVFEEEVEKKKFYFVDDRKNYLPIAIDFSKKVVNIKGSVIKNAFLLKQLSKTKTDNLMVKSEEDFVFSVKKIDVFEGSQVIFIQKIIIQLKKDLKFKDINLVNLNERITYLIEYLINIDYSFKDKTQERNVPIKVRQKLLWKFNIVSIMASFLDYILINYKNKFDSAYKNLSLFLINVKKLFTYLSRGEEAIKISIYVLALNQIIAFEEIISQGNSQDFSKLIYFIFDLVHHSEILQNYLLGESAHLKKYIKKDFYLSEIHIDLDNLPSKKKLFELIETNKDFLMSYQNLIILNKVQYKRQEIIKDIKEHVEQIQFKAKNNIASEKMNYLKMVNESYDNIKKIIKNNIILLEKFLENPSSFQRLNSKTRGSILRSKLTSMNKGFMKLDSLRIDTGKKISPFPKIEDIHEDTPFNIITKIKTYEEEPKKIDEYQEIKTGSQNTLSNLLTQETKEVEIEPKKDNAEINIRNIQSSTIPAESERKQLLEKSTFRNFKVNKRMSFLPNFDNRGSIRRTLSNILTSVRVGKEKDSEKSKSKKTLNPFENLRRTKERYEKILKKLGRIWSFINWYKSFGFENLVFILDDVFNNILHGKINNEKEKLYYFINLRKNKTFIVNNNRINSSSRVCILFLLRLFNHLFKKTKSSLDPELDNKSKLENKIAGKILKDMGEENKLDEEYIDIKTEKDLEDIIDRDIKNIDENLGVFYSTYQFYINQYVQIVHILLKSLSNVFINQETFESIKKMKLCFEKTLTLLLSKVEFMNDSTINLLYQKAKKYPTLLGQVFDYKTLIEHSIRLIVKNFKRVNRSQVITNYLMKDQTLINYLYSMCKECYEMKCLYEKLYIFKYIRDFIFSKQTKQDLSEKEFDEQVKKQLKMILKLIWEKKRIRILEVYEKFNNNKVKSQLTEEHKKKLNEIYTNNTEQTDFWDNYFYESFKVGDITKFTLKVLKFYEIDEFFGNIIFIDRDNNEFFFGSENRSIKKIKKLIDQISDIEQQIFRLKLIYSLSSEENNPKNNCNDSSIVIISDDYKSLYHSLGRIHSDALDVFNFNQIDFKPPNILYQMLLMENKSFYRKIDFLTTLKSMIISITYFGGKIDFNILGYASNILRIFSNMITLYPDFNETIQPNFGTYIDLIISSFNCISKYPNELINFKIEMVFLEVMYRALDNFLYIIKNCSLKFKDIKEFIESVFAGIQNILYKFRSQKNRYIYRILYLLGICRILLYLNENKSYDLYSYKLFYKNIFNIEEIEKYFISDLTQSKDTNDKHEMETIEEENSKNQESIEISGVDKNEKSNLIFDLNNFPEEMHPFQLDNSNKKEESKNTSDIKNGVVDIKNEKTIHTEEDEKDDDEEKNDNVDDNNILIEESNDMYDDSEIENLSFYVSFLLIYNLYLNEKNSVIKESDEDNKEADVQQPDLSLENLFLKFKRFLSLKKDIKTNPKILSSKDINNITNINNINNITNIVNPNNLSALLNITTAKININEIKQSPDIISSFTSNIGENTMYPLYDILDEEKSVISPQYLFIFAILQSINNFKNSYKNHNIEIPVKQYLPRNELYEESEIDDSLLNDSESLFGKNEKNNNSILFYYYNASHIDIIILEKIMIEISLKIYVKNYCLELAEEGNETQPGLLKELLHNLNYYKLMKKYKIKEYNLVNNLFVKNNLAQLIKKILTLFKSSDLDEISEMKHFMYKRMGEVYNQEQIKPEKDSDSRNMGLVEFLKLIDSQNKNISDNINLLPFLQSLIYASSKYEKNTCLILYKTGFQFLKNKCFILNNHKKEGEVEADTNLFLIHVIQITKELFRSETYRNIIEDEYVFDTMLLSLRELLKSISEKYIFFSKKFELIKEFLNSLDFILGQLSEEYKDIIEFMKRPENLIDSVNFYQQKMKLEKNLEFFINLLNFKKTFEEKILTEKIIKFEKEILKGVMKLIMLILDIEKDKSLEIINILLNFLCEFIKGPDIENLNLIFSLGFFDLISYIIKTIDYYKLFLNYINKDNIYRMIDSYAKIECKILKTFIAYYNISFSSKSSNEDFKNMQQWYDINFPKIEKKFKKLFYMSEKEMEKKRYSINDMLLSIRDDDNYTIEEIRKRVGLRTENDNKNQKDNISKTKKNNNNNNINNNININNINDNNSNEDNNMINNSNSNENDTNLNNINNKPVNDNNDNNNDNNTNDNNNDDNNDNENEDDGQNEQRKNGNHKEKIKDNSYCIIKFDLLLVYYALFNYHKDLSNKEEKFKISHKNKSNIIFTLFYAVISIIYGFIKFVYGLLSIFMPLIYYIYQCFKPQLKKDVDFLQDLQEVERKCENIRINQIINFLRNHIKKVEVSINNILYKVYFPMIDKSNTLLEYRKEYLKVNEIDSSDFINILLSKYDYIYIRAKQNSLVNNLLFKIPIINIIFKNMNGIGILLIISGLFSTFLILTSFTTFDTDKANFCGKRIIHYRYAKHYGRIQCPKSIFDGDNGPNSTVILINVIIAIQSIFQGLIFMDYTIRNIFIIYDRARFDFISNKIKNSDLKADFTISKLDYFLHIILPTLFKYFWNFRTIYYILSLFFIILSLTIHPFFNCVILLEFVNRISVMQNIVRAMYRPSKNILIILLMFILLEYFFSFLAQSFFTYHFPNLDDTKNFFKIFMRMMDQTFKQDGGIGTYLDKSLEQTYEAHSLSEIMFVRIIFDALFYFVVVLLVFQMFLSIIIDYFNETRENSENFNDDLETGCLICGINREEIEKINPNDKNAFDKHIRNSHNVFNYIYYLIYLQSIDDRDVIIEEGVWNLHLEKNFSYLPKKEFFKNLEKIRWEKYNKRDEDKNK